jgi:GxxExxY protein
MEVHRHLGPGLLESAYERSLAYELEMAGIVFDKQVPMAIDYKGIDLDYGYRADLLVDNQVIVELKSADRITSLHHAQLLTYMRLSAIGTGLLINFNVRRLTYGIKRFKL